MEIWDTCGGASNIEVIEKNAWRMVEDQSRSSTRKIVDTVEEHDLLERMLDQSKPKIKYYGDEKAFEELHYLLSTPFRYPPLKRGSRFGLRTERNLFYASLELNTSMAEKAFHRFDFLLASQGNIGGKSINCTAFKVNIKTKKGIDLCKHPFSSFRHDISSPTTYTTSQALGSTLRKNGIEAFISYSARTFDNGKNINVFTPLAFSDNSSLEKTYQTFQCYSTKNTVEFYSNLTPQNEPVVFNVANFYVNGQFRSILE